MGKEGIKDIVKVIMIAVKWGDLDVDDATAQIMTMLEEERTRQQGFTEKLLTK